MKTRLILAILFVTGLGLAGCSKKEDSPTPPADDAKEATSVMDSVKESASKAVSEFTAGIDVDKAVSDLKAEAAKMSLDDLQDVATKYKKAIMEKQVDIDAITEKLKAIPMTEKLGADAQKLTGELKILGEALKPLTDRFQVYVDAIKVKGGDLSALTL